MPSCLQGGAPAKLRESSQLGSLHGPTGLPAGSFVFAISILFQSLKLIGEEEVRYSASFHPAATEATAARALELLRQDCCGGHYKKHCTNTQPSDIMGRIGDKMSPKCPRG